MATNTVIWIVVAVVAALLLIAVLAMMARKRRNQRRHHEAERIREDVQDRHQRIEKRAVVAEQAEAKARAAAAEADAKAAEAKRLRDVAATHHEAVTTTRQELDERRKLADELDPHTPKTDDRQADMPVAGKHEAPGYDQAPGGQAPGYGQAPGGQTPGGQTPEGQRAADYGRTAADHRTR